MENFPKKRGRPRKIPDSPVPGLPGLEIPEVPEHVRDLFDGANRTGRTRANRFYADRARYAVEGLSKNVRIPDDPVYAAKLRVGMDWMLKRKTVLTELGRMMTTENPTEQELDRFHATIHHIAARHDKLTAKAACAYIRRRRLGETKRRERVATLHHDLNTAINLHRQRFPESTWADVQRALEHTAKQVERKL